MKKELMETKKCKKCLRSFLATKDFFYRDRRGALGLRSQCKECENQIKIDYRQKEVNKERRRKYERAYYKKRRQKDPTFKLRKDVSSIVRRKLAGKKENSSLWKYLPYTPKQLKEHLEEQFDKKMTWENHGTYWHIDHIIPQASFRFSSMKDKSFQECWSLNNLQPLEAIENLRKSNKGSQ